MRIRSLSFDAKKTIKGKFKPSSAAEAEFYRALRRVAEASGHIVDQHVDGVKIDNNFELQARLKDYSEKITPWATRQSAKLLEQVQRSNKRAYSNKSKLMGKILDFNFAQSDVGKIALRLLNEQVALIKSIPIESGLRAQKLAYEAILHGTRAEVDPNVVADIQEQLGLSTDIAISRAKLIAVTETARANASINQARAVAVGSNQYEWHNSGDGAVRESHRIYKGKPMQGMVFSWDSPPTLSDGMKGHPGNFPNCRCFAFPIFNEE